jgi:hypothetical protein
VCTPDNYIYAHIKEGFLESIRYLEVSNWLMGLGFGINHRHDLSHMPFGFDSFDFGLRSPERCDMIKYFLPIRVSEGFIMGKVFNVCV